MRSITTKRDIDDPRQQTVISTFKCCNIMVSAMSRPIREIIERKSNKRSTRSTAAKKSVVCLSSKEEVEKKTETL